MSIVWSGLAPHPPIIVESVGGARCREVQSTIDSMWTLVQDLLASGPDRLILISPHTPRPRSGIAGWFKGRVTGDLSRFGAPETRVDLPIDEGWMTGFRTAYPQAQDLGSEPLDHGAFVPLHFVVEAGWRGPTCVFGLPNWSRGEDLENIAAALAASAARGKTAVLASGDMSHCLKPGAPASFDKRGQLFDTAFVDKLRKGSYKEACHLDPDLQEAACQDVVESCHIAWSANRYRDNNFRFLSYEGPFGVGYTVMKFYGEDA